MFLDFLSFAEKIGVLVFSQKCFKFWNLYLIYFDFSSIAVVNWWYYRENEFKKVFPSPHEEMFLKIKFSLVAIYFVIHWQCQNHFFS